jgi:hypothetical protein
MFAQVDDGILTQRNTDFETAAIAGPAIFNASLAFVAVFVRRSASAILRDAKFDF